MDKELIIKKLNRSYKLNFDNNHNFIKNINCLLNENKYLIEYAIELQNKNRKLMKQKAILIKKQKS